MYKLSYRVLHKEEQLNMLHLLKLTYNQEWQSCKKMVKGINTKSFSFWHPESSVLFLRPPAYQNGFQTGYGALILSLFGKGTAPSVFVWQFICLVVLMPS